MKYALSDIFIIILMIVIAIMFNDIAGIEIALTQAVLSFFILRADKKYNKANTFMLIYAILVLLTMINVISNLIAVAYSCWVYGSAITTLIEWRQFHRLRKEKIKCENQL